MKFLGFSCGGDDVDANTTIIKLFTIFITTAFAVAEATTEEKENANDDAGPF